MRKAKGRAAQVAVAWAIFGALRVDFVTRRIRALTRFQ